MAAEYLSDEQGVIAVAKCGCIRGWMAQGELSTREGRKATRDWQKRGYSLKIVPTPSVRDAEWRCAEHKALANRMAGEKASA